MNEAELDTTDSSLLQQALAHHMAGRLDEAAALYRALPAQPDAIHLLGVVALQQGRPIEAVEQIARAIELNPRNPEYHCNLGGACHDLKLFDEALGCYARALALRPDFALARNNLGNALRELGRLDEAVDSFRCALALQPNYAEAHLNLGSSLRKMGRLDEAIASYRQALAIQPGLADAHYNLGNLLAGQGNLSGACACFRDALAARPGLHLASNNLALALADLGKLDDAIASLARCLAQTPDFGEAQSNLLFCHNYHPTLAATQIFSAYDEWNSRHAAALLPRPLSFANAPDPRRRLKIGYVSADFRKHSAIHFLVPLLEHHDKAQVEVVCYSNNTLHDAYTERVMAAADRWVPCSGLDDEALARRIREDGIDVLVDLSGHTQGHRLLVFARKPAPVQVSWLGFGYTTGLTAIDYFIGDPVFTPPGCDPLFSERIHRLPHCFAVFQPPETPPLSALPARANGHVTYGCCSRGVRINARVIEAWSAILRKTPGSRLRIDSGTFRDASLCEDIVRRFAASGITRDRLDIRHTPCVWDVYQAIDIMLDCFPHNSGTTTYEALWMGVPVVTLAERPSVGRIGASILSALGKPEWIAGNADQYVERAAALARDLDLLERHRGQLRQAMSDSPLMDHATFARDMEAAYRTMWAHWCAKGQSSE